MNSFVKEFLKEHKEAVKFIGSLLGIILAVYIAVFIPVSKKKNRFLNEFCSAQNKLIEYRAAPEGMPSEETIEKLKKQHVDLKQKYVFLKRDITQNVFSADMPVEESRLPLYFKKKLYQTGSRIWMNARKAGMRIPATLGFSSAMPDKNKVRGLLAQLSMIERLIDIAKNDKIKAVSIIKPSAFKNVSKGKSYDEYSVLMKIHCTTEALFNFIYHLGADGNYFILKNMLIITDNRGNKSEAVTRGKVRPFSRLKPPVFLDNNFIN